MTDLFEIEAPTTTTSLELRRLQREERRRRRRLRPLAATAVALVIFALGASIAWSFVQALKPVTDEVADFTGVGQGTVQIVVNPGEDGRAIAATLLENGVIASEGAFILEWNDNQDAARLIQPRVLLAPTGDEGGVRAPVLDGPRQKALHQYHDPGRLDTRQDSRQDRVRDGVLPRRGTSDSCQYRGDWASSRGRRQP